MKHYKPYEKYKDSGIAWLGEVPEHWEVRRLKYAVSINDESLLETTNGEFTFDYIDIESVQEGKIIKRTPLKFKDSPSRARRVVKNGDVIVSTVRTYLKAIVQIENTFNDLIVSTGFAVLRPGKLIDIRFLNYCARANTFIDEIVANSKGVSYPAITSSELSNIPILLPSPEEQTAIARFLDYKLSKINRFIRKKKQLIKLLNEQKAAIINQAVTKGLDPNARMKDSGIDWLGEVPEHWEVRKLKYVANFQSGEMITSESIEETGDYPVFGGGGFRGYTNSYTNDGEHVLIGRQGALCGNIKYAEGKFWASEHAIVTYPKIQIETFFLGEILRVSNLGSLSQTAAQPGISIGQIEHVKVPVPPLPEQGQIASYIETETALLTTAISKIEKEISLVEEYKTALIAEAVTGKIDVRGYKVPEQAPEEEDFELVEDALDLDAEDAAEYETEEME